MRKIIGYAIVNGEKVDIIDYSCARNRLNQVDWTQDVKVRDTNGEWLIADDANEVYEYR